MRKRIEHRDDERGEAVVPATATKALVDPRHRLGDVALDGEAIAHVGRQGRHHERG
jgi:hypothetical protein